MKGLEISGKVYLLVPPRRFIGFSTGVYILDQPNRKIQSATRELSFVMFMTVI